MYQLFVRILFTLTHCCVLRQESRDSDGIFGGFSDPKGSDFHRRRQFELPGLIEQLGEKGCETDVIGAFKQRKGRFSIEIHD
jgi:hypothetical protein